MPPDEAKIFLAQPPAGKRRVLWIFGALLFALVLAFFGHRFFVDETVPDVSHKEASAPTVVIAPSIKPPTPEVHSQPPPVPAPVNETRSALAAIERHLLLYLPFSSSLEDHSPKHLEGTVSGAIDVSEGAAHFPGDAYIAFPHIPLDNRPFAFSVWIKAEGLVSGYGLLEQAGGGPGKHLHILMRDPDRPYLGFYLNDLRATQSIKGNRGWTHLTFQYTGSRQQIWIDGKLDVEQVADSFHGDQGETRIGHAPMWNNVPAQCFFGAMRDVRLYDIALTPEQIRMIVDLDWNPPDPNKKANPLPEAKKKAAEFF